MTRALILTEDRTAGGLERLVQKAVQRQLSEEGLPPLSFQRGTWAVHNNDQLIKRCRLYGSFRFKFGFDHVVFVIDANQGWRLVGMDGPSGDLNAYLSRLTSALTEKMTEQARSDQSDASWSGMSHGFHPQVLVWERESLMLPVADALELGEPEDPYAERGAAAWMEKRHRFSGRKKYVKAIDGPLYLKRIADDPSLLDRVLASNASLRAIVDGLVEAVRPR